MLSIEDLKDAGVPHVEPPKPEAQDGYRPMLLEPDSAAARALMSVWRGDPVTIVDAPPGSGKTRCVEVVLSHLVHRLGIAIHVACYTREQAMAMANRLVVRLPERTVRLVMRGASVDPAYDPAAPWGSIDARVTVGTLASAKHNGSKADLMVVDEAYQATFADVAEAAADIPQLLLVGDPGQIGPVVSVDTSAWSMLRQAPHLRSPEVFGLREDAVRHSIDKTFRLGPVTTQIIQPLYAFPFGSARPDRSIVTDAGALPEVAQLSLGRMDAVDDQNAMAAVVRRAVSFLGAQYEGEDGSRLLDESDVAVVVSRRTQVAIVSAMLAGLGHDRITVGTADKLQGGQWAAVVAVDAAAGLDEVTDYLTALGRLCVMISRHTTHLTWCHADGWHSLLTRQKTREAALSVSVRSQLTRTPAAQ